MSDALSHYDLWAGLLGGLALFLFGMDQLTRALKTVAGEQMKGVLARLTANRFFGVATGAAVTALIQSSSVTTVIMVGFISAGLMTLAQSIPVIMGANIGTTVTAQILAFKVTKLALPLVAVGFAALFLAKSDRMRQGGALVMGFGLVFYGMTVMSEAMAPLRSYPPFLQAMVSMDNRFLGIAVGAVFTALVQSSSATTGIIIVLAGQGLVTLPGAIALTFGANIGTCVTALLAAIGKPREAKRAALAHVIFNVAGVLLFVTFIPELAILVSDIAPTAGTPRQVAHAHTLFNVANTLVLVWFAPQIARLTEIAVPKVPHVKPTVIAPKYLDEGLIKTPVLALDMARKELGRLGGLVEAMMKAVLPAALTGSKEDLEAVRGMDADVDILHECIVRYLSHISIEELAERETDHIMQLMEGAHVLEQIGDVIETNMVWVGLARIKEKIVVSEKTAEIIAAYHSEVSKALHKVNVAVAANDPNAARKVRDKKATIRAQTKEAVRHQMTRLTASEPNRLKTFSREMEIIENLNQIFRLCRRLAKTVAGGEK